MIDKNIDHENDVTCNATQRQLENLDKSFRLSKNRNGRVVKYQLGHFYGLLKCVWCMWSISVLKKKEITRDILPKKKIARPVGKFFFLWIFLKGLCLVYFIKFCQILAMKINVSEEISFVQLNDKHTNHSFTCGHIGLPIVIIESYKQTGLTLEDIQLYVWQTFLNTTMF